MKKLIFNLFLFSISFAVYIYIQENFVQKNVERVSIRMNIIFDELLPLINSTKNIDYLVMGDSSAFHSIIPQKITQDSWSLCVPGSSPLDMLKLIQKIDISKIKKGIIIQNSFSVKHVDDDFFNYLVKTKLYNFFELFEIYSLKKDLDQDQISIIEKIKFYYTVFKIRFYLSWEDIARLKTYITFKMSNVQSLKQIFTNEIISAQGYYSIKDVKGINLNNYKFKFDIKKNDLEAIKKIAEIFKDKKVYLVLPDWIKNAEDISNLVNKLIAQKIDNIVLVRNLHHNIPDSYYWDNSHLKTNGSYLFSENLKKFIEKN